MMKYIESEYSIINNTPCAICGGDFFAEGMGIEVVNGIPYDICECVCSNCGNEKIFEFVSPVSSYDKLKKIRKKLN